MTAARSTLHERKETQKRHYDTIALNYSPNSLIGAKAIIPACRAPYDFIEKYFMGEPCIRGKRVLDYACGSGYFSIFMAKAGMRASGVDISPLCIDFAREYALFNGVESDCEFMVDDCENLKFGENDFNYLVSLGNLSCLRLDKAVSEMSRVLDENGTAVILDTLGHNPLLNLNRKLKFLRGKKTEYHVGHVLKIDELKVFNKYFHSVDIKYFDLTALCLYPLKYRYEKFTSRIAALLSRIDRRILSVDIFKPLAFKFVAILSKPRKLTTTSKIL